MSITSLLIVGGDPEAHAAANAAARLAFPSAEITRVATIAEAGGRKWLPSREMLLLLRPSPGEFQDAVKMHDPRGLPRWPVVAFGEGSPPEGAQTVSPDHWKNGEGARVLAAAAALHELAWDNERLRGDLRTLGGRFNHDLRTPLNCVSTAGDALGKTSANPSSSRAPFAQALHEAVGEISILIERVSFVLKATADPPPLRTVAMKDVVWAALQRLDARRQKLGATIVQPESWPSVEGVAHWLEVIWVNLIANGLAHGGPAPRIELGWVKDSHEFQFTVRDHGAGVPARKRADLFTPFDLLHEFNAPRGFGLPIVHRLVEMQGGRCSYEEPPGGGASFSFFLPA